MAKVQRAELNNGDLVVVDTNVLETTSLLTNPISISLLYYLEKAEIGLGISEVVEQEWREHFVEAVNLKWKEASRAISWLNRTTGTIQTLPDINPADEADEAFSRRLGEIANVTEQIMIRKDDWREAGEMVIAKRPPSAKGNQQYKDSLIWRGLLHEGKQRRVVFVTQDKAFTDGQGGLDATLLAEAIEEGADIEVASDLTEVLEMLTTVSQDVASAIGEIGETLKEQFKNAVDEELDIKGLNTGSLTDWQATYFATPDPSETTALIVAEYELRRQDDPSLWEDFAFVEVHGTANVESSNLITSIEVDSVKTIVMTPHKDLIDWVVGEGLPRSSTQPRWVALNI